MWTAVGVKVACNCMIIIRTSPRDRTSNIRKDAIDCICVVEAWILASVAMSDTWSSSAYRNLNAQRLIPPSFALAGAWCSVTREGHRLSANEPSITVVQCNRLECAVYCCYSLTSLSAQILRCARGLFSRDRGETETRHYCASKRPLDRGVKTEATSHIHIIQRTDVVLKRSGDA